MPNLSAGIRITPDDVAHLRPLTYPSTSSRPGLTGSLAIGDAGEVVLSFQDVSTVVAVRRALEALEVRMELDARHTERAAALKAAAVNALGERP